MQAEKKQKRPGASDVIAPYEDPAPWVSRYIADRLNREARAAGRGFNALIAKATGFSEVHVGKVRHGKCGAGDKFARAIEHHWRLRRHELEDIAGDWWARSDLRAQDLFDGIVEATEGDPKLIEEVVALCHEFLGQKARYGNSEFEAASSRSIPHHPMTPPKRHRVIRPTAAPAKKKKR